MTNPYPLAKELARPVARGYLTLTEAHAELLLAACQGCARGYPTMTLPASGASSVTSWGCTSRPRNVGAT